MSFDKTKAMRNAERYVAQGKISAAISEYRAVVDNDPRDIATLNMLGDLYAKSSDKRQAVDCYLQVADHYNAQGFAQKAIAIYNKVSRIQPDSIEVSAKLAELHKVKGSLAEARAHYTTLAQHHEKNGRRIEALAMWKQIALLDPNNTDVCLSLADSYLKENQIDDAVEAYAEAAARFSRQSSHEDAILALMKGFEVRPTDLRILGGLVKAQTALGRAYKAATLLEEILNDDPYNRDVLYLLIECCMESQNAAGAEKAVIRLVEIEPANYPKFLELIRIYLNVNDPESAARILTMCSEYLLAGGEAEACGKWINEILERDPMQLSGLRLFIRYNSWLKDEAGFQLALERLYAAASTLGSPEDERFALAQLVVIRPHETGYRDRLNEINAEFGFEDSEIDAELLRSQFAPETEEDKSEAEAADTAKLNGNKPNADVPEVERFDSQDDVMDAEIIDSPEDRKPAKARKKAAKLSHADEEKIQRELDSIHFYIENDYNDLAEKALKELAAEFGDREEFATLRSRIGAVLDEAEDEPTAAEPIVDEEVAEPVVEEEVAAPVVEEQVAVPVVEEQIAEPVAEEVVGNTLGIDEIRTEFGIDGPDEAGDGDYDTHYQMAVAYQEMGLIEEALREYQDAIAVTDPKDGTRRFYQCANLLGHCFMLNGMANHAITWFARALETDAISDEEFHGLWYELALAHEASGDEDQAAALFEKIYAENVDFRDVAKRVKHVVNH